MRILVRGLTRYTVTLVCTLLTTELMHAQPGVTARIRARSTVQLAPPDSTVALRVLTRPPVSAVSTVAASGAVVVAPTAATPLSPLVLAARKRAATMPMPPSRNPAPGVPQDTATSRTQPAFATDSTPIDAARTLAAAYYGSHARLATVRVTSDGSAGVWVGDRPEKQKAPAGLDVAEAVVLPFRYVAVNQKSGEVMALKPWFDDGGGLRYDSRLGGYVATLRVGLRDTLHVNRPAVLTPKIRMSVAAVADSVSPELLEIGETNVFITKTRLVSRRATQGMQVTLWPDFSDRGVDVWINVHPDTLIVQATPESIAGFGLDETTITVTLPSGAVAPNDTIAVRLRSAVGAFVNDVVVKPTGSTPASIKLRSRGMALDTISASAGLLVGGAARVDYVFPGSLVFGGLFGAILGAVLLAVRDRRRPEATGFGWVMLSGMLTGFLLALIAAVGAAKFTGLALSAGGGTIVSIIAGALGGYVGPKGLEKLVSVFGAGSEVVPATAAPPTKP